MSRGTALITGASSGIGAALAKQCAAGGYDVVLVARRADMLATLARDLTAVHGIDAQVITADLAQESAPDELVRALNGHAIDILINNAGFGVNGPFTSNAWDDERRLLQVNVLALVRLTKLILPAMVARGSGRVLNVASTAAFVPGPFMAMYYASKAFVFSFSLSIANEVQSTGVTVTALCPGPTRTEFGDVAGISGSRLFQGPAMSAEAVAKEGYAGMMAGKPEVIAGARNRWMILGTRLAPRTMLAAITRRLNSSLQ
jgi:short-subunit dehydrogenase